MPARALAAVNSHIFRYKWHFLGGVLFVILSTLLAIWPANVQMALDAGSGRNKGPADSKLLMWARVPLQLPMIATAWRAARP